MTDEQRTRVLQRVKARIVGVTDLRFEVDELGEVVSYGTVGGALHEVPVPDFGPEPDERLLVQAVCDAWRARGATILAELELHSDLAVVLGPHRLVIAEQQRAVTSTPRAKVDASQPYTAEEAEADVERVARVLADAERHRRAGGVDDDAEIVREARKRASLLLSKLHGWKRGAPPSSPGHHHARSIFEEGS